MKKIKEFLNEEQITNSVIFWTILYYVVFGLLFIFKPQAAAICVLIGSIMLIACWIDSISMRYILWAPLTITFWFAMALLAIIFVGIFIYESTILKFNNWLDKKNSNESN